MSNTTGAIVWSADYKPFGEATVTVNTITNNLRFPGQYYDAETGLNYNYFRDYNPAIGRYIEADPIGFEGGDVNLYVYVGNNPVRFVDSEGLTYNGNLWTGFEKQDMKCSTLLGIPLNWNQCTKNCCIQHDICYTVYKCNMSSMGSSGAPYACNKCNSDLFNCLRKNIIKSGCKCQ